MIDDHINEFISKFVLCILLTQSGKTFTAIEKIITEIDQDIDLGRSIHIVFSMNTLFNNKQFAKRLQSIEDTYGKGSICIFSSKYDGKYKHIKNRLELQGLCADETTCPRVVVMCSNKKRYDDGEDFLKVIDKNIINICRVFAYYDELHKYINDKLREQIETIHDLDIVKGITALTASPDRIFQKKEGFWNKIKLIQLDDFSYSNYVGFKDMNFNCIDDFFTLPYKRPHPFDYDEKDKQTIEFINYVLQKYPKILANNTRSFIPAHIRRTGHNTVRNLIFDINGNAVVIVINGNEKTLQYKNSNGDIISVELISQNEELCETISKIILNNNLQNRAIVITGLLCIGMGQTLTHKSTGSFTSCIISHLDLPNDELYQLFGRITGRMKDWDDKYKQTTIYCPSIIKNRCNVMEECAIKMACDHNGEIISQEDYREPMLKMGKIGKDAIENIRISKEKKETKIKIEDTDKNIMLFDTQVEAIRFGKEFINYNFNQRFTSIAPKELQTNGKNPSCDELFKRMWGLNKKHPARMIPTLENKWCVYWRPSLLK